MSKRSRKHHRGHRYGNPESLMREAGKVLVATAVGGAVAVGANMATAKVSTDARVQAGVLAGVCVAGGVALHVNDMAPRVGKALAGAGVGIAGSQMAAHYEVESRVRGLLGAATPAACPAGTTTAPNTTCACPSGQRRNTAGTACEVTPGGYPGLPAPMSAGYPSPGVPQRRDRVPAGGYPMSGTVRR